MSNDTELTPYQIDVISDLREMFEHPLSGHGLGWYANVLIEMFVALWLISWVMDIIFWKWWEKYQKMSILTRRNVITYFHEIVITSVLLIWALYLLDSILFYPDYNKSNLTQLLFIGMILIVLYLFELIYRLEMRWQLILHHLVTITLLILSVTKFEHDSYIDDNNVPVLKVYNVKGALLMALTALTEQPIFMGLLLYRLGYKYPKLFYASAIQNAICKLILHAGMIHMYFNDKVYEDPFWKWFMFLAVTIVLLPVQLYACWIQFLIGRRLHAKQQEEKKNKESKSNSKSSENKNEQEMTQIQKNPTKSPKTKRNKTTGEATKPKRRSNPNTKNKEVRKKESKRKNNNDDVVVNMPTDNDAIETDINDPIDDYIGTIREEKMYESESEEDDLITNLVSNSSQSLINTIPRSTSFIKRGKSSILNIPKQ